MRGVLSHVQGMHGNVVDPLKVMKVSGCVLVDRLDALHRIDLHREKG